MKIRIMAAAIMVAVASFAAVPQSTQASDQKLREATFRTQDGKIYAPDQSEFIARGINIRTEDMDAVAKTGTTLFPGINFIRLAIDNGSYPAPAVFRSFVSQMTAKRIVVTIEDHPDRKSVV